LQFAPQNSANQRPTMALLSCSLLIDIESPVRFLAWWSGVQVSLASIVIRLRHRAGLFLVPRIETRLWALCEKLRRRKVPAEPVGAPSPEKGLFRSFLEMTGFYASSWSTRPGGPEDRFAKTSSLAVRVLERQYIVIDRAESAVRPMLHTMVNLQLSIFLQAKGKNSRQLLWG
jgi:hypothetical protein